MLKKITCEIRCLETETVRAAKEEMKGAPVGKVPFLCKLSGKREDILLISDDTAKRLEALIPSIGGLLAQKIAAAICGAELCECDIATLTERDEGQVLDELERLRANKVVQFREIAGMKYYSLVNTKARELLNKYISDLETT